MSSYVNKTTKFPFEKQLYTLWDVREYMWYCKRSNKFLACYYVHSQYLSELCLLLWIRFDSWMERTFTMPHMPEWNWTNAFYISEKVVITHFCTFHYHDYKWNIAKQKLFKSWSVCSSRLCPTVSFHNYRRLPLSCPISRSFCLAWLFLQMASYIALYTSLESCSFICPKMVHAYLSYFSCTHFVALGVQSCLCTYSLSAYRHPKNGPHTHSAQVFLCRQIWMIWRWIRMANNNPT